nr:Bacterial extracellular solute-binding protein [uncultured bacterium]
MRLLKNEDIGNSNSKNDKKSIYLSVRTEIVIIISVFILIISPFVFNAFSGQGGKEPQIELYLSADCEAFFGRELIEKLFLEFEEQNPNLKIRLLSDFGEKDREPDVFVFDKGDFNSLIAGGKLMPLEPFPGAETAVGDNESKQLAIPIVSFMDLLFYNIELLQAAGFDRPPKTRDDFLAFAGAVSKGNDETISGFAMGLNPKDKQSLYRDIFSWIWASGNDFWTDEKSPVINNRPIIRDISFLGRVYREEILAPLSFDTTGDQLLEKFAEGKTAMMIASTRAIPELREKMGNDIFGITTIPDSGQAGKYSVGLSGIYAGINSAAAYPQAARIFLEYLAGSIPLFCAELKAVPGDVTDLFSSDYKDYMKDDPFYSKAWDIFESSQIVHGFSGKARGEEFENIFFEELKIFFESGQPASQRAADAAAAAAAAAIQQRWDEVYGKED